MNGQDKGLIHQLQLASFYALGSKCIGMVLNFFLAFLIIKYLSASSSVTVILITDWFLAEKSNVCVDV